MDRDLAQDAISSALSGDWELAVKLNKSIISQKPSDADALNRLARAYSELGDFVKARKAAQEVLKFDPFNSIALKAINKWRGLKKGDEFKTDSLAPQYFLEEPGKTKIVSLMHLGDSKLIAKLDAGDKMLFNTHSHRVSVTTADNKYIGRLPDDLSARLRKLIKYGNEYVACVKSVDKKEVRIFIRETKRDKKLADIPSFTSEKIDYVSFTPPEMVHNKDELVNDFSEEDSE